MAVAGLAATDARAQSYPTKSVRVLVGLAPGGGTDVTARILMQKLTENIGQNFVVDNRPGAGSLVAIEMAKNATPDGYTLIYVSPEFAVNPSLHAKATYDPVRDFSPIAQSVFSQYFLAVRAAVPANSVKELIAYAKSQPKPLNYASSGIASANHLAGEMFKTMTGIDMTHVPYKSSGLAVSALIAGEVQVQFSSITAVLQHVKAGRIKALAATGPRRPAIAPDVPTVVESGLPEFIVTGWYAFLAPAKTPKPIIDKLNAETNRALPALRDRYADLGTEIVGGSPQDFTAFLRKEVDKWAKVVKASGAKAE